MTGPVRAVRSDRVTGGSFTVVTVGDRRLLVGRLPDGEVVAFDAACPHQGQPLTFGEIEDGCIVCPHHRYAYDPDTGRNVHPGDDEDVRLPVHDAEDRDGWIWITL